MPPQGGCGIFEPGTPDTEVIALAIVKVHVEIFMKQMREKKTIEFTEFGVIIKDSSQTVLKLSAGEALMLLDILKNEEDQLRNMVREASPIPITLLKL